MDERLERAFEASKQQVMVRSELAVPAPERLPLFDLEEIDSIETLKAILPERTMLFRSIFVDFVEVLRACNPDQIHVVRGKDRPYDLVFMSAGEGYMANHVRSENVLGHLDSFDQATDQELFLALRCAEALQASIPIMAWETVSEGKHCLLKDRFEVFYLQDSNSFVGTWITGSVSQEDGVQWVRTIVPYPLITQEPFLPLVILDHRVEDDGRNKSLFLEGTGGDLVFAM